MASRLLYARRPAATLTLLILVAALSAAGPGFGSMPPARSRRPSTAGGRARPRPARLCLRLAERRRLPFRFELNCDGVSCCSAAASLPLEIKSRGVLVAAQVYQPKLLISEFHGPLTVANRARRRISSSLELPQSSVSGTPAAPERVSPRGRSSAVDRVTGGRNRLCFAPAYRNPRPHRRGRSRSPRGRGGAAAQCRHRAGTASGASTRSTRHSAVLRGSAISRPSLGGAVSLDPSGRRRHRIGAGAGAAGRRHRSRRRSLKRSMQCRLDGQLRVTVPPGLRRSFNASARQQMVQASPSMDKNRRRSAGPAVARVSAAMARSRSAPILRPASKHARRARHTLEGKPAVTLRWRSPTGDFAGEPDPGRKAPANCSRITVVRRAN